MLCDREKENIPKSQMGFIDFLISPLTEQFLKLFPEVGREFSENLVRNRRKWMELFLKSSDLEGEALAKEEAGLKASHEKWKGKFSEYLPATEELSKVDDDLSTGVTVGRMARLKKGLKKRFSVVGATM